jgi:hypothetical protein
MLTEDQADTVMIDIEAMTELGVWGWADMLQHLYELHQMRDQAIYDYVWERMIVGQTDYGLITHTKFSTFLQM